MPRIQKCETCRLRRVKCDEERPSCGPCSVRGRICVYADAENVDPTASSLPSSSTATVDRQNTSTGLILQTARSAPSGQGAYYTLTTSKPIGSTSSAASIPPVLSGNDTTLAARWVNMIGTDSAAIQAFELVTGWATWIPSRINTSPLIDLAVIFVVDSHQLFKARTDENAKKAETSAADAMKALRSRLAAHHSRHDTEDLLLTVHLLYFAEVLRGIDNLNCFVHVTGLSQLFKTRWASGLYEDLDHAIIRTFFLEEMTGSVVTGNDSVLHQALRSRSACFRPDTLSSEHDQVLNLVMQHAARISYLLRWLRRWADRPEDVIAKQQALDLMQQLHAPAPQSKIETFMHEHTTIAETDTNSCPFLPVPAFSFFFDTLQAFWLGISFYTCKAFTCAIALQILDLPGRGGVGFDRALITREALSTAENITKCTQYAVSFHSDLPTTEMRMMKPMIISWGLCDMVEESVNTQIDINAETGDSEGGQRLIRDQAMGLKGYFRQALTHISTRWHSKPSSLSEDLLRRYRAAFLEGSRYTPSATPQYDVTEFQW